MNEVLLSMLNRELQETINEFMKYNTELREFKISERKKIKKLKRDLLGMLGGVIINKVSEFIGKYNIFGVVIYEMFLERVYEIDTESKEKIITYYVILEFSGFRENPVSIKLFEERKRKNKVIIPILKIWKLD